MFAFFFGIGISGYDSHDKDASEIVKKKCNKGIHDELAFEGFAKLEHVVNDGAEHTENEKNEEAKECHNNVLDPRCIGRHKVHPKFILHALHFRSINDDAIVVHADIIVEGLSQSTFICCCSRYR